MSSRRQVAFAVTKQVHDTCLCLHVQRAARALARRFDDALRPADLTHGQFSLMMALNRPAPPAMAEVAALLGMDRTSLTAMLKALERRNLVVVTHDAADRRTRRMRLTQAGHASLAAALPLWTAAHAALDRRLGASEADRLRALLATLD